MPQPTASQPKISDRIDRVMRNLTGDSTLADHTSPARRHAVVLLAAGLAYGAVMGTFGGLGFSRMPQVAYSAVKAPLLLLLTFGLSLPSFFVLNSLFGLSGDFARTFRARYPPRLP